MRFTTVHESADRKAILWTFPYPDDSSCWLSDQEDLGPDFPAPDAKRALIVSSHEWLLSNLHVRLSVAGFEVADAGDGIECLSTLRSWSPHILILDPHVLWGGGDGILDAIRLEGLAIETLVLISNEPTTSMDRFGIPTSLHLRKPVNVAKLVRWLCEHVQYQRSST